MLLWDRSQLSVVLGGFLAVKLVLGTSMADENGPEEPLEDTSAV
jgi:hypothetical protein